MAIKADYRPRCHHQVVYPLDNCTSCMKEEIDRLNSHIIAIGQKLYEAQKELQKEQQRSEELQNDVFRWFKYIKLENIKNIDLNEYWVTLNLYQKLFKNG
jgi:glycerol-3-phosphate cytidylyltransferase-like family protein